MAKRKTARRGVTTVSPAVPAAPAAEEAQVRPKGDLVTDETLSQPEVVQVLQKRTRALAQIPPVPEAGETIPVVVFAVGEETYAVEARHVEGVYPLEGLTPVPCTPDFVVGVVNLRGRILSVLDLRRFLGLPGVDLGGQAQVIAVSAAGLEIGLVATAVRAVSVLPAASLGPALPTTGQVAAEFTRGVTPDLVVLLDLEALLQHPRVVVREEV